MKKSCYEITSLEINENMDVFGKLIYKAAFEDRYSHMKHSNLVGIFDKPGYKVSAGNLMRYICNNLPNELKIKVSEFYIRELISTKEGNKIINEAIKDVENLF